jgi:DNA-directed RNA polymerase specialized sigma24 family protein
MKLEPIFASGEAEGIVKELRQHLRDAEEHRQQGRRLPAEYSEECAVRLTKNILSRLANRFTHYAETGLAGRSNDLKEDGIQQMYRLIWQGLNDLSGKPGAMAYETHFNSIVQNRIIDALRLVKGIEERVDGQRLLSLDESNEDEEGGQSDTLAETYEDKRATASLESVLDEEVRALFYQRIPTEKHRKVLTSRAAGDNWDVVAVKAGVTAKTARKYDAELRQLLTTLLQNQN